jgi:hypothetical protein
MQPAILVACHSENDPDAAKLFSYSPPDFNTPTPLVSDYVDPQYPGKRWKDFPAESKDIIWDQYCPVMWPFQNVKDFLYHDKIFYDLFDDGWKILKPGGMLVFPYPADFTGMYGKPIPTETGLANFKSVLKRLLARHPWKTHIVKRTSMPLIVSEQYEQEKYEDYILFVKHVSGGRKTIRRRKARAYRSRKASWPSTRASLRR